MRDIFDDELRRVAAALVEEAPPPPPMPQRAPEETVGAGHLPRRRLRLAMGAAAALTVAVAVTALLSGDDRKSVTAGPPGDPHPPGRTATAPTLPPAERLVIRQEAREVLADGSLRDLPVPADFSLSWSYGLGDGRFVMLGSRDLMPGVPRRDGANVKGVAFPLLVAAPDGTVQVDRDVRVQGQWVQLLTATPTEAILSRSPANSGGGPIGQAKIVAHDLTTGNERLIGLPGHTPWAGDIAGDLLVVASAGPGAPYGQYQTGAGPCRLDVFRLAGGGIRPNEVRLPDCQEVYEVKVSPDGRYAAAAYGIFKGDYPEDRLVIVPLAGGPPVSDEHLGNPYSCPPERCPGLEPLSYVGAAWLDTRTLRVALSDLGKEPPGNRNVTKDSLRLLERTVPADVKPETPSQPTATCSAPQVAELVRIRDFVAGQTWTTRKDIAFGIVTDTSRCLVRVQTDQLNDEEQKTLRAAGGQSLEIDAVAPPRRSG